LCLFLAMPDRGQTASRLSSSSAHGASPPFFPDASSSHGDHDVSTNCAVSDWRHVESCLGVRYKGSPALDLRAPEPPPVMERYLETLLPESSKEQLENLQREFGEYLFKELARFREHVVQSEAQASAERNEFRMHLSALKMMVSKNFSDTHTVLQSFSDRLGDMEQHLQSMAHGTSSETPKGSSLPLGSLSPSGFAWPAKLKDLDARLTSAISEFDVVHNLQTEQAEQMEALKSQHVSDLELVALDIFQIATSKVKHTWQLNTSQYMHGGGLGSQGLSTSSSSDSRDGVYHARSVINKIHASSASIAANRYTFKESVRDAALFANVSGLGSNGNAVLLGAIVVSGIVQLLLCLMVAHLAMSSQGHLSETIETQLQNWRTETSPDVLMSVCVHDYRAQENSLQILFHEELQRYSQSMFGTRMSWGPTLCVLVMFSWTLTILGVVRDLFDALAAYAWAYKKECKEMQIMETIQKYSVEELPGGRVVWMFVVVVFQLLIAFSLLFFGCLWLGTLVDLGELLFTAIALNYIVNIDEFCYIILVPNQVKIILRNLDTLPLPSYKRKLWTQLLSPGSTRPVVSLVVMFFFIVVMFIFVLRPHIDRVVDIRVAMCP